MENKEFTKPTIEVIDMNENEVIATSGALEARGILNGWGAGANDEEW